MKRFILLVIGLSIIFMTGISSALTIVNSSSFDETLNNGTFITDSAAASSLFNQELFTSGNETKSGSVQFSDIPYFDFGSTLYFQFVYDMQETGGSGKRLLSLDDIIVSAGGSAVWNYDQALFGSIILNSSEPYSSTPLNAGGDLELYVPVALFNGMGLTGSDFLTLTVTQSSSDNGTDEWVVLGSGSGGSFFGNDDPISDPPTAAVPEPQTMILFGLGLIGIAAVGRRKT